jgi:hypothetical protein
MLIGAFSLDYPIRAALIASKRYSCSASSAITLKDLL